MSRLATQCKVWVFLLLTCLAAGRSLAQVSVSATGGTTGPTSYATLNAAFAAINAGTHQGAVSITITGNTTEPATAVPLVRSGSGSSSYTSIAIAPVGNDTVFSAASPTASRGVIEFNGADNVTIDGDDPNVSGTQQNLVFASRTSTSAGIAVIRFASSSATDGATNNTVRNCVIMGSRTAASTTANYGIYSGTSGTGSTSTTGTSDNNDNLTISNNTIVRCYYGIYCGATTANYMDNLVISGNTIGSGVAGMEVGLRGILVSNTQAVATAGSSVATIETNDIRVLGVASSAAAGIEIGSGNAGIIVRRNRIHDIVNNNTGGYGAYGISITSATSNAGIFIANNFIWDCVNVAWGSNTTTSDLPAGIRVSAAPTGLKLYYNSVSLNAPEISNTTASSNYIISVGMMFTTAITGTDLRNNIFSNTQPDSNTNDRRYAIYVSSTSSTFSTSDNNIYYYGTPSTRRLLGYYGSAKADLAAYRAASTQDNASRTVDPAFVSSTDLHLTAANTTATSITAVTTDIDNDPRNAAYPDAGGDEFPKPPCTGAPVATITPTTYGICPGSTTTISASSTGTPVSGLALQYEDSSAGGSFANATGGSGANTFNYTTPAFSGTPIYYRLRLTCTATGQVSYTNVVTVTNPNPPTQQDTAIVATAQTLNSITASWSVGNGNDRVVYINTTNNFTPPSGTAGPGTPNRVYTGNGQQLVYDSSGSNVTVTGLIAGGTYYFRVYEVQRCGATYYYNTSAASGNPAPLRTLDYLRYNITRQTNLNYVPVSAAAVSVKPAGTRVDDANYGPFTFFPITYAGRTIDQFRVSTNGFMTLNATNSTSQYQNGLTADLSNNYVLAPFWEDLIIDSVGQFLKYEVTGNTGNRVLTVQWENVEIYQYPGPSLNFQVKIFESDSHIEYAYGVMQGFDGTNPNNNFVTNGFAFSYTTGMNSGSWGTYPAAGEAIGLQASNTTSFTSLYGSSANNGINSRSILPDCYSGYRFVPTANVRPNDPPPNVPTAPINDNANNAITLTALPTTPSDFCGSFYNNRFATRSAGTNDSAANARPDDDVWFKFTAISTNTTITVRGSGGFDAAVQLYNASNLTTAIASKNVNGLTGTSLTETITPSDVNTVVGNVYYVRIYHAGGGIQATATAILSNDTITGFNVTNAGSGYITAYNNVTPVVYITDAAGRGAVAKATVSGTGTISGIAIQGNQKGFGYVNPVVTVAPPSFGVTGDFSVIVNATPTPPANDDSCGAIALTVDTTCNPVSGSTYTAGPSQQAATCGGIADDDVWYKWTALTATDKVTVDSDSGFNASLQVYSLSGTGQSCTDTFNSIGCQNLTGIGGIETFNGTSLVPGRVYFARVYHFGSGAGTGSFKICVTAGAPSCPTVTAPANNATVTASTGTTITWDSTAGATSYDVYLDTSANPTTLVASAQTSRSYATGPLAAGDTFYYRIQPRNAAGFNAGCTVYAFNTNIPRCVTRPITPANDTTQCRPSNTVLSFAAVTGATGYDIYLDSGNVAQTLVSANQSGTSYNAGSLAATRYSWRVVPRNGNGPAAGCNDTFHFTYLALPAITVTPNGPLSFCAPGTRQLTVTTNAANPQYSYLQDNRLVTNASGSTYTATSGGSYRAIVRDASTTCSDTSAPVNIQINALPGNLQLTASNGSICIGDSTVLMATASRSFNENFEVFPTQFTFTGTADTFRRNTTYYIQGTSSGYLRQAALSDTGFITMNTSVDLRGYQDPKLTFYQIAATEAGYDYAFIDYSVDNGATWNVFPSTDYLGAGELQNTGVISFDKSSYPDWDSRFSSSTSTPGTGPATSLWKRESINLASYDTARQFKMRFRQRTDGSVTYYGWLIDSVAFTGAGNIVSYAYTSNPGGFTSTAQNPSVSPGVNTIYTVTATTDAGCVATASDTVVVNAVNVWNGSQSNDWNTPGNWGCGSVPRPNTDVLIPTNSATQPVISATSTARNLNIQTGASVFVVPSGNLSIYGNLTTVGTLDGSLGTVRINGSTSSQTLGAFSAGTLVMNNPQGATITANVTVSNQLSLISGILTIGNNNVYVNQAGTATGSATSYVRTNGTGTLTQPVGTSPVTYAVGNSAYNPITLSNTGTADNYPVRVIDDILSSGNTGTTLADPVVKRSWSVSEQTAGGSNLTVTLQWNQGEEINAFNYNSVYVAHYNAATGRWETPDNASLNTNYPGAGAPQTANPYTVQQTNVSTLGLFGVGSNAGTTNVTSQGSRAESVSVYPNPVRDILTIEISKPVRATADLLDMSGKLIKQIRIDGSKATLDMSQLAAGTYFVRYADDVQTHSFKVTK